MNRTILILLGASLGVVGLANVTSPKAPVQFAVVERFKIGGDGGWDYLTLDPASRRLYVSRGNRIDVVNADTGKVEGTIGGLKGAHQAVFAPKLNRGFTSNGGDDSVTIFDLATLKEIEAVKVGNRPDAILFDDASGRVFTFNAASKDATAVDAKTGKVAGSVPLGGKPEFCAADGRGKVFVNVEDTNEVVCFNSKSLKVLKHWSIKPGDSPTGLGFDPAHRRLFSVCDGGRMMVSDSVRSKLVGEVPIGKGPDACVFDPKLGLVFSSNGEGTLTIARQESPDKYQVIQTLVTQRGARTCALDPTTHRIYLATAETQAVEGQRRPRMVPGTFVILVVGPA
ncbi:MAG: YncE family protein [Fimbriimonas ginsengisoli]|uniref:YncE family protein n=1 Tax=Fimbriimonas ginsengisoli TaxID=1005039 RepID=A0A931M1Q1_FIMGI|nr:YncE family protein [Fimbriimonas ginsengisoli]MBI3722161.1 YncE family protein [Fimbriimonas ginsengisoli]